ncbi:MAG: HAD-IIA family hydrolase [Roseiflexaceae bacterium]
MDLRQYDTLLLDMDGVLYRGHERLDGADTLIQFCQQHGIKMACITNNATMTPEQFAEKLAGMGIEFPATHIINSPVATRRYLEGLVPQGTKIFCIGMNGLRTALFADGYFIEDNQQPAYVIVGLDTEVTYAKLRQATLLISAGAKFIGTNPDVSLPLPEGLVPGCGALLALLAAATGVQPFIIGKPGPTMFHIATDVLGADPRKTLTIGDRLDTDIAGSLAANMTAGLVLTGVVTRADVEASDIKPDIVYTDLPELLHAWQGALAQQ